MNQNSAFVGLGASRDAFLVLKLRLGDWRQVSFSGTCR